jgi:hypothetical protein
MLEKAISESVLVKSLPVKSVPVKSVLVTLGGLLPLGLLGLFGGADVKAQGQFQPNLQDDFPLLELPTAVSASALGDLQYRKLSTDFDTVMAPASEPTNPTNTVGSSMTEPTGVGQSKQIDPLRNQPIYTQVEPNRAIETQTDPQRLTVVAPTTRPDRP